MGTECVRVKVYGRVQGVFFRAAMSEVASANRVVGWVKNNADGSVDALLQGTEEDVKIVKNWARHGPPGASVESIEVRGAKLDRNLRDFRIVR